MQAELALTGSSLSGKIAAVRVELILRTAVKTNF